MTQRDEDEEEEQRRRAASPTHKAWFAGHADSENAISAGFRGVPGIPHGGAQSVTHHDIAGSMNWCWCGQPFDHDWPGKADGRKHPKESKEPAVPQTTPTEEQPRIERRSLRAYNADLADIILSAVNDYHVKYRVTAHSVILFPPDKSAPYAINARNGDRQVKPAMKWFGQHCVPQDISIKQAAKPALSTKPVDEVAVKELAEMINSAEHLPKLDEPPKATVEPPPPAKAPAKKAAVKKAPAPPAPTPEEPKAADFAGVQGVKDSDVAAASEKERKAAEPVKNEKWVPYIPNESKGNTKPHPFYVTNGETVRCTIDGWLGKPRSLGGHTRTHHTDTESLWGKEAKSRATDTLHNNMLVVQVGEAITMLQRSIGITPQTVDVEALQNEIKDLKAKVKELSGGSGEVKALTKQVHEITVERDALKQKLSDIETRQALAREALGL